MAPLIFFFGLLIGGCTTFYSQSFNQLQKTTFYWSDEEAQEVANATVNDFLVSDFFKKNRKKCYKFGKIVNKTYEHIDTQHLVKKIRLFLQQGGSVCIKMDVNNTDGIFYGTISAIYQESKREKDMFYTFRLYLIDSQTTQLLWSTTKEIRKRGRRKLIGW